MQGEKEEDCFDSEWQIHVQGDTGENKEKERG